MRDSEKTEAQLIEEVQALRAENERLKTETGLRQGEDKFRAGFDLSPDAIFLASTTTGCIVEANPAAAALLERPIEQIVGMHQAELHPPDQLTDASNSFTFRSASGAVAPPVEIDVLCAGQTRKLVEIRGGVIELGGVPYVLGTFRDIGDQKQAETKIRQNQRELRAMIDAAGDSMLLLKSDGEIVECNQVVADRFGKTRSEPIGSNAFEPFSPDVAEYR
jgi:PAS domain S-box-containing protein